MVKLNSFMSGDVALYDSPFELEIPDGHAVATLVKNDTAIVVSLSNFDGRCVYVVGPNGAGWTFGALLEKVR